MFEWVQYPYGCTGPVLHCTVHVYSWGRKLASRLFSSFRARILDGRTDTLKECRLSWEDTAGVESWVAGRAASSNPTRSTVLLCAVRKQQDFSFSFLSRKQCQYDSIIPLEPLSGNTRAGGATVNILYCSRTASPAGLQYFTVFAGLKWSVPLTSFQCPTRALKARVFTRYLWGGVSWSKQ